MEVAKWSLEWPAPQPPAQMAWRQLAHSMPMYRSTRSMIALGHRATAIPEVHLPPGLEPDQRPIPQSLTQFHPE
jgi:hypothetical protein